MPYVKGHYRRNSNGRSSYVRGHYRSPSGAGFGLDQIGGFVVLSVAILLTFWPFLFGYWITGELGGNEDIKIGIGVLFEVAYLGIAAWILTGVHVKREAAEQQYIQEQERLIQESAQRDIDSLNSSYAEIVDHWKALAERQELNDLDLLNEAISQLKSEIKILNPVEDRIKLIVCNEALSQLKSDRKKYKHRLG